MKHEEWLDKYAPLPDLVAKGMTVTGGPEHIRQQRRVVAAYNAWLAGDTSVENVMDTARHYLSRKQGVVRNADSKDPDDYVQDRCSDLWRVICKGQFESGFNFLLYVSKMSRNSKSKAIANFIEYRSTHVPMTVTVSNADGDVDEIEHPAINGTDRNHREWRFRIPASIGGVDREIIRLIMDGEEYWQIAQLLRITESAVKLRIARMKKKLSGTKPGMWS